MLSKTYTELKRRIESNDGTLDPKFQRLPSMIDLDMSINEEGDTLFDIIKNEDADMPDEVFNSKDLLKSKLMVLLNSLDDREKSNY